MLGDLTKRDESKLTEMCERTHPAQVLAFVANWMRDRVPGIRESAIPHAGFLADQWDRHSNDVLRALDYQVTPKAEETVK